MYQKYRDLWDAALYLVLFLLLQMVVMAIAGAISMGLSGEFTVAAKAIGSMVSSLLAIALFAWRRWSQSERSYTRSGLRSSLPWVITLTLGTIVPLMLLQDLLHLQLSAEDAQLFKEMVASDYGFFALSLLAPVAEEMVFRGAVLRKLLDHTGHRRRWLAIALSAAVFAVAHGNMAQGLNALLMGLLLGWMYCRTRNVLPGIVLHWVNNTFAFVLIKFVPQAADMTIVDLYGGDWTRIALATIFSLAIFLASLYQLQSRLSR